MKTSPVFDSACVQETEPTTCWLGIVHGEPEPLLLSRLLQRLVTQQAVLLSLCYNLAPDRRACVEITFSSTKSRAERLEKQWRTLVSVHEANVQPRHC